MQNKGALKVLIIALAIACAYQLSFTLVTKMVERDAQKYGKGDAVKQQAYLDSIRTETVYNLGLIKFNYKDCKEKEINLGLDLRGGMNVMLEISVEDIVRALSNDSKDPIFLQAMAEAKASKKLSSEDFIGLFAKSYSKLSGGAPLALLFNTPDLKELISSSSTNDQVVKVLREQSESAITNSFNVLRNRIDRFGVSQPNIQRLEGSGRILVELPGVKEPERVRKLLQGTASLEFWATYNNSEIFPMLRESEGAIKEYLEAEKTAVVSDSTATGAVVGDTTKKATVALVDQMGVAKKDSLTVSATANAADQSPLFSKLIPAIDPSSGQMLPGSTVGYANVKDTATVNKYLNLPQVRSHLPRDLKLMWGVKGSSRFEGGNTYELYAIRANTRDGKAPLDGGSVVDAKEQYADKGANAEVTMVMNSTGSRKWAQLTADNVGKAIAIVLDGFVYSAPNVNAEITGGRSQITGNFTINEAKDLAIVLKSGKLPAPARIIQEAVVGPSLGQESIDAGISSFIMAFLIVLLYMILFYSTAGVIASVALVSNLFLLFGVLTSMSAVLTLPGIAGIVLTMGMAVDANVIIYERIKEELRAGKGLGEAVKDGFSNAYSAIIDGQATTLITGIVLFIFGTGPVQGFATTLIIGILTSLFCAIIITRLIISSLIDKNKSIKFSTKFTENFLSKTKINFIGLRKYAYIIIGVLILASTASFFSRGLNYGVDFSGGRVYVIRFDSPVAANEVRTALQTVFTDRDASFEVKQYGAGNQMRIFTQYKYDDSSEDATTEVNKMMYKALGPLYKTQLTEREFMTTDVNINGIVTSDKVGPSVANDIKRNSIIAVIFSLIAIGLYIVLRFKRWQWALGGVVGLTFNAFITIGLFSALYGIVPFALEVDQSFIAAILTIIGYTINDTVIIFDRIRENQRNHAKRSLKDNINNGINSTLSRTINTAGTTLIVLLAIFLFGGEVIRGFIFAMLFGIFMGTLSSIFVATPVAYDLMKGKEHEEEKPVEAKAKIAK